MRKKVVHFSKLCRDFEPSFGAMFLSQLWASHITKFCYVSCGFIILQDLMWLRTWAYSLVDDTTSNFRSQIHMTQLDWANLTFLITSFWSHWTCQSYLPFLYKPYSLNHSFTRDLVLLDWLHQNCWLCENSPSDQSCWKTILIVSRCIIKLFMVLLHSNLFRENHLKHFLNSTHPLNKLLQRFDFAHQHFELMYRLEECPFMLLLFVCFQL